MSDTRSSYGNPVPFGLCLFAGRSSFSKIGGMKNPHDKIFKETLTRRENAISFFWEYLPGDIVSQLDWRTS